MAVMGTLGNIGSCHKLLAVKQTVKQYVLLVLSLLLLSSSFGEHTKPRTLINTDLPGIKKTLLRMCKEAGWVAVGVNNESREQKRLNDNILP